jgi:CRP/FNR family transcriptional regulator, cyclic AMP receptor protein
MDPALADRLCTVSLFADLERDHLAAVAELVDDFECEPGVVLAHPGMVGAGIFLISEGEVEVTLRDRQVTLGPGEILGELALLDDRHVHTNRAKTKTTVRGYSISRSAFDRLLHDEPGIAIPILKVVAKRLVDNLTHH